MIGGHREGFLIDEGLANFILTGSSVRKLKKAGANLLPERVKTFHPDPLNWAELGWIKESRVDELAMPSGGSAPGIAYSIEDAMTFGSLPGIVKIAAEGDRKVAVTMGSHPERLSDTITAIPWTHPESPLWETGIPVLRRPSGLP